MRHAALVLTPLLIGVAVLLRPAGASAADAVVSPDPTATDVSAFADVLVWSRRVGPGRYRLVQRRAGSISDAPVSAFRHTVDADLGPGRSGGVVAVYARCRSSRKCDLFELELGSGEERRLRTISSERRAEVAPSNWRGRHVFTRAARFSTKEREFTSFGIVGYRGGGLFENPPLLRISRSLPFETDLRGSRAAFRVGRADIAGDTAIVLKVLRRRGKGNLCEVIRVVGEDGLGDDDEVVTSPVLAGGFLYWAQTRSPGRFSEPVAASTSIHRARIPGRRCRFRGRDEASRDIVVGPSAFPSIATDGRRFFYTSDEGVKQASDPLAFGVPRAAAVTLEPAGSRSPRSG